MKQLNSLSVYTSGADICAPVQHSSCAPVRVGFLLRIHVLTLLDFKKPIKYVGFFLIGFGTTVPLADVLVGARLSPQSRITIHYKSIIPTPCQDSPLFVVQVSAGLTVLCRFHFESISCFSKSIYGF